MGFTIMQQLRDVKNRIGQLLPGQLGFSTDTEELLIGSGDGNRNVSIGGSKWLTGTDLTAQTDTEYVDCPTVKVGDLYLNTDNGNVFKCAQGGSGISAKWSYDGNLKGVKGDDGANGTDGEKGDKGDTGAKGADGATFTPSVSSDGILSWANNGGKENPPDIDLKNLIFTDSMVTKIATIASKGYAPTYSKYYMKSQSYPVCTNLDQYKVSSYAEISSFADTGVMRVENKSLLPKSSNDTVYFYAKAEGHPWEDEEKIVQRLLYNDDTVYERVEMLRDYVTGEIANPSFGVWYEGSIF